MKIQKPNLQAKGIEDFISGATDSKIETPAKPQKDNAHTELKRQTYYISPLLIDALALMSAFEKKDKSVLVREFFMKCIPEKYIEQARKLNDSNNE